MATLRSYSTISIRAFALGMLLMVCMSLCLGQYSFTEEMPNAMLWSDAACYVSTAKRIARTNRPYTGCHRFEDLLLYQTRDYRPIHKPMYAISLGYWSKWASFKGAAFWFNRLLFCLLVVGLAWALRNMLPLNRAQFAYAALFLCCSPMAFAYSNTLMMETFVLFVGAVLWMIWFSPLPGFWKASTQASFRIVGLLVWTVVAYMTRQTLVGLTLAILLVHPLVMWRTQRRGLRRKWWRRAALLLLILGLAAFLVWERGQPTATFPNFATQVFNISHLSGRLALIKERLLLNLRYYFFWYYVPHDVYHIYSWICLLTTVVLCWLSRRHRASLAFRSNAVALVFWLGSLGIVLLLYDNYAWRSHRVLMINILLSNLGFLLYVLRNRRGERRRFFAMGVWLALQLSFAAWMVFFTSSYRHKYRGYTHPLLAQKELSPGALVVSHDDWLLLSQAPHIELVYNAPDGWPLLEVVKRFRPAFAITTGSLDLRMYNYRRWPSQIPGRRWVWERYTPRRIQRRLQWSHRLRGDRQRTKRQRRRQAHHHR